MLLYYCTEQHEHSSKHLIFYSTEGGNSSGCGTTWVMVSKRLSFHFWANYSFKGQKEGGRGLSKPKLWPSLVPINLDFHYEWTYGKNALKCIHYGPFIPQLSVFRHSVCLYISCHKTKGVATLAKTGSLSIVNSIAMHEAQLTKRSHHSLSSFIIISAPYSLLNGKMKYSSWTRKHTKDKNKSYKTI